jgi:hypothetical protein
LNFVGAGLTAADDSTRSNITLNAATATADGIVNTVSQTYAGRKTFNQGSTQLGLASLEPVLTVQLASGATSTARLQEWRDPFSTVIAYVDATPSFTMACDVLPDVDYPTTARHLGNSGRRWAEVGTGQITWNSSNVRDIFGSGSPTGISAPAGCVYRNTLGTAGQTLWVRESAAWVAVGAGVGGGANIQLSNLDNSGTITNPAVSINTHLGFSVDGGWNIGAPAHRVGSMYLLGTFFMYPIGSTNPASPKAFGFLDPGNSAGTEYTRVLLSGNQSVAQGGFNQRTQITCYHSLELRGNRRSNTAPAFTNISGTDSSSVLVYLDASPAPDCIPLLVNTASTINSDLFHCQNGGVTKFRVDAFGSISSLGGTRFGLLELQPASNATTAITSNIRTLCVDTLNGPQNVTLPSALANPGMIVEIIHIRAVQKILTPTAGVPVGYDQVVNVKTTGSDVFNAWPGTDPQATNFKLSYPGFNGIGSPDNQHKIIKVIADNTYNVWWLMPYFL